jgi:Rod binding domain-containing protein
MTIQASSIHRSLAASVSHTTSGAATDKVPAKNAVLKNAKAAQDFEALLLTPVLDALQKTFAGGGEDEKTPGADDYRQMGTQALAQAIAARGGIGIAQLVLRHFEAPKVSGGS